LNFGTTTIGGDRPVVLVMIVMVMICGEIGPQFVFLFLLELEQESTAMARDRDRDREQQSGKQIGTT